MPDILDLLGWWNPLTLELQIFYTVAIVSTLILIFQAVLMLFGVGVGNGDLGEVAGDHDVGHGGGLQILSVRTVIAFMVGFGWSGVIALRGGVPLVGAIAIAIAVGGAFMLAVFFLMRTLYGLRETGTLDYGNAVGQVGTVYVTVPARCERSGQIEVMVQGRLAIVSAYTRGDRAIPSAAKVKVTDLMDAQSVIVEPIE